MEKKTAEDYLAHMLGVQLNTIRNNPLATVTVEEALDMCNAFSNQQLAEYKAKLKERVVGCRSWHTGALINLINSIT